jgi:hypothetical protein
VNLTAVRKPASDARNMANIKCICLSDLHLGAPSALLTDTPDLDEGGEPISASPLRDALSRALVATLGAFYGSEEAAARPTLVLLGDIFDFSLGTPKSSIDTFDAVLKSLATAGAQKWFTELVLVPGNHDHELWTATRLQNMVGTSIDLDRYTHTTPAFAPLSELPVAAIMDRVLDRNGFSPARTYYPNMGLASKDRTRAVVLHHGHFIESMYRAMSILTAELDGSAASAQDVETLERLNGSWIDFVWSSDGDDGRLGVDVRAGFDYLLTGREDIRFDHRLARLVARTAMARLPVPQTAKVRHLTEVIARAAIDGIVGQYGQMERFSYFQTLGADGLAGLTSYLSGPVLTQIAEELGSAGPTAPVRDVTFVFGHTHKPFQSRIVAPGFTKPPAIYNTGGWDLDMPMFGTRLGAAAVFIDDDLNVASLRLCDVPDEDGPEAGSPSRGVRVETADGTLSGNPLAQRLQSAVTEVQPAWSSFSLAADQAYRIKQAYALALLREEDRLARGGRRVL